MFLNTYLGKPDALRMTVATQSIQTTCVPRSTVIHTLSVYYKKKKKNAFLEMRVLSEQALYKIYSMVPMELQVF